MSVARKYIRTEAVYEQFKTVLLVDALWLTPPVCQVHADLSGSAAAKALCTDEKTQFYITMAPHDDIYNFLSVSDPYAAWQLYLSDDSGALYEPISIMRTELDPAFNAIFGPCYSRFANPCWARFRGAYIVTFPEKIEPPFTLEMRSPAYAVSLCWRG